MTHAKLWLASTTPPSAFRDRTICSSHYTYFSNGMRCCPRGKETRCRRNVATSTVCMMFVLPFHVISRKRTSYSCMKIPFVGRMTKSPRGTKYENKPPKIRVTHLQASSVGNLESVTKLFLIRVFTDISGVWSCVCPEEAIWPSPPPSESVNKRANARSQKDSDERKSDRPIFSCGAYPCREIPLYSESRIEESWRERGGCLHFCCCSDRYFSRRKRRRVGEEEK